MKVRQGFLNGLVIPNNALNSLEISGSTTYSNVNWLDFNFIL